MSHDRSDAELNEELVPEEELSTDEVPSKRVDAGITVVILFVTVGMLAQSTQFDAITLGSSADPGPVFWPRIVLVITITTAVLNLGLIYRRVRAEGKSLLPERTIISRGFAQRFTDLSNEERQFYVTIALMIGYLLVLEPVGYLTSTPVFLFAFAWIVGYRHPLKLVATSLGVSAAIFVGFRVYMNIPLPYGSGPFRAFHIAVENLF